MAVPRYHQHRRMDAFACLIEPLLRDLVFQHLSGRDVLNIFAVSKDFNEAAMTSSKAMSKIKLKVEWEPLKNKLTDLNLVIKNRRPYKCAEVLVGDKLCFDQIILLLKKLSSKLEEVKMFDFASSPLHIPVNMNFPLLKRLDLEFWDLDEAHNVIALTSEHLQELSLFEMSTFFDFPIPAIKGNLILFSYVTEMPLEEQQRDNFKKFLSLVSSTLQTLEFETCSFDDFEFILTKLPALKVLKVSELEFDEAPQHLENQTITTLHIQNTEEFSTLNTLKSMKNLETILVSEEEPFEEVLRQAKDAKMLKKIIVGESVRYPNTIYRVSMEADSTIPRGIEIIHR